MAKKNDTEQTGATQEKEFVQVKRITNDEFVVFPDRIVFFVDDVATVTLEERDQLKAMGVI